MEVKNRRMEFDYVRTLALLCIALVHITEEFNGGVYGDNAPGAVLEFLSGAIGAPSFMACMGACMLFARRQSAGAYAMRGLSLLGVGYALNLVRCAIPYLLYYLASRDPAWLAQVLPEALNVDILQFAGLSYLLIALSVRLRMRDWQLAVMAVALSIAGFFLKRVMPSSELGVLLAGLFWFINIESTCFPVLPWFILPAFGYLLGKRLIACPDETAVGRFYRRAALVAVGVMLVAALLLPLFGSSVQAVLVMTDETLFMLDLPVALICCGVVTLWLWLLFWVARLLRGCKRLNRFTVWLSQSVNVYYCIHWILIGWTQAFWRQFAPMPQWLIAVIGAFYTLVGLWLTGRQRGYGAGKTPAVQNGQIQDSENNTDRSAA